MKLSWWLRFVLFAFLTITSICLVIPSVFHLDEKGPFPLKSKVNLGLDLQGGLYMILGIDFQKVYADEVKAFGVKIQGVLKDQVSVNSEVGEVDKSDPLDPKVYVNLAPGSDMEKAKSKIKEWMGGLMRITGEQGNNLQFALSTTYKKEIEQNSVTKSIEVIRNRIDEFGVTEPEILSQGNDRIIVQLPGVKDIERAKGLIGQTAKLSFKLVNDAIPGATLQEWVSKAKAAGIEFKSGVRYSDYLAKINEFLKADLPKGNELVFEKTMSKATNEVVSMVPFLVEEIAKVTGEDLQDASVQIDQQKNRPFVSMAFKPQGGKKFEDVTAAGVGKRMAVILDGNVYTAPSINEKISGGHAQITLGNGDFNQLLKNAKDIALVLRAGALPVQLDFLEQRIVGPSLGQDSIKKAVMASILGSAVVFLFMIVYYRTSGVIAVFTLIINGLLVVASLILVDATLTLPGIAGIALTIGMAVDGNIVIYERIREELRKGVSPFKAVEDGFSSAFWTLIDANITTAIAGLCLLNFGTGPVKGFAVTLLIGIVSTVYTSYYLSHIIFEFLINKTDIKRLSI